MGNNASHIYEHRPKTSNLRSLGLSCGSLQASGLREVPEDSMFGRFSAKLNPKTPLDRRGSSYNSGCTTNQPRRLILKPFPDDAWVLPDSTGTIPEEPGPTTSQTKKPMSQKESLEHAGGDNLT